VYTDVTESRRLYTQLLNSEKLRAIGEMASGVAHDFNNLLAAILNYVNFATEELARHIDSRPPDLADGLDGVLNDIAQIGAAAERAARLTHQLLAFGRREVIKPEVLDVNAIVTEVESLLRRTIGEHVTLVTQCVDDLNCVCADRGQIEQVLLNLAVNARDAMEGGGTLTIETSNVVIDPEYASRQLGLQEGSHIRLRVTDTGAGMSQDTIAHAFEPFFTTKPKEKGSGLGLATVYGIVAQAGGMVSLYSEPDMGTTVTILLPSVSSPITAAETPRGVTHHHGGETVLVVEDEDLVRDVASRILIRNGYRVLTARSGAEALEIVDREGDEIDLLLTDVVMPGLTGNEVAEQVSRRFPQVRVLYMSGYPESVVTSSGVVEEGIRLISKPFVEPELLDSVRGVLDA
jgi:nitrogen-specific signal transduction histidine kinase